MAVCNVAVSGTRPSTVSARTALGAGIPALPCPIRPARNAAHRSLVALRAQRKDEQGTGSTGSKDVLIPARSVSGSLDEDAPFMEPLIRTLLLGVGAGGLVEAAHVLLTLGNAAHQTTAGLSVIPALIAHSAALKPLWIFDHAVAIGVWALLYLLEARTISNIIDKHPHDPSQAARTIRSTMTLPKRMLPLSLTAAKRALYQMVTGTNPSVARANAGIPDMPNRSAFTTGDFAREAARRAAQNPASPPSRGGAGTSVLDRPPVAPPKEEKPVENVVIPPTKPAPMPKKLKPLREPGQTKEDKRERELRERNAYLKNFWYAAGVSEMIKDEPKEVQILGRTVVLFRDENGKVRCLENLCPHRGAPLGQGWTKDVGGKKCVVCPYHAWGFDGEGRLQDVPSQIKGNLPKRPIVDTYAVEERGGFIWLFFGSQSMPMEERPPIPVIPELEDPNWQPVYAEMEFESPHWSAFDNALDMAHIHYVHDGSFGNPDKPEILDMDMKRDTFGITGTFKIHNKPVNKLWEWTRVPYVPVEVRGFLPMTSAVKITLGFGVQMITFVNTAPIDENRSVMRFALLRNFATSPLMDGFVRSEMTKILTEDKVMVETVRPDEMKQEYSLEADAPQIAFRKLRQEWVDMGYAVDPQATKGHRGSLNM